MRLKKVLCLALATAMVASLAACGGGSSDAGTTTAADGSAAAETTADADEGEDVDEADYDAVSEAVYMDSLSEFYDLYNQAQEAESDSERFALMAASEAKLLESAVYVPTQCIGGAYAIRRIAPYTIDYCDWGNDAYRYHQGLVTTELIKTEDRAAMKEKWAELRGTGEYAEWAEQYLIDQGYTLKDTYSIAYNTDPTTWDALNTSRSADSEAIVNTYDGLIEYDDEGVMQSALAESWEVSDDGLTYTFHLRQGAKWCDSQGRELGEVTADDFVAGLQHMIDAAAGLEYLVGSEGCNIVNAEAYTYGEITDFSEVGVKAEDDYTLVYTLEEPCSFFMSMLGYGVFAPLNRSYYESQGGKFGAEFDAAASDYTYGVDADHIAYCGPYLVTNATEKNTIVFQANENYWNADNIKLHTITWMYNDGSDPTKAYNDCLAGTTDGCTLTTSTLEIAKNDGNFDTYADESLTDATSFGVFFNLNRQNYSNINDSTKAVSEQTDEDAARTNAAMQNVHFRRALAFGLDRGSYNAQEYGDDLKYNALINSFVPGTFVMTEEDVTITVDGTDYSFPADTNYGEMIQAILDADGVPIQAWNEERNSSAGYDGWYNPENAMAELEIAIEELAEEGIVIDEENPIYLDLPYPSNDEVYTNKENAVKQSLADSLGGAVVVNLVECTDYDQWTYAGYYCEYGYECNYDLYDCSGWGPDYGDPQTYLSCLLPYYEGYMTMNLGIY